MKALLHVLSGSLVVWCSVTQAASVNINQASADEIADALNGIGKAKAMAIVADREKNGAFTSIDELKRVQGIKDAVIAKNRDVISLDGNKP